MSWFGSQRIYMDYASAPPVSEAAIRAMRTAETLRGNPGGIHSEAVQAMHALNTARASIAAQIGVRSREVIFTSGLTESNNLAILGFARSLERKRRSLQDTHWVVSSIEHSCVLDSFGEIERLGGVVSHVMPDEKGRIQPEAVCAALRENTVFVSVGWANNEIGIVQNLSKIQGLIARHESEHKTEVIFHTDAGQAPLYLPSTAHTLGVDLLSFGGNKLYGPHGIGALFVGNRADIVRVSHGGPQERKLRPGTESVALAAGFAAAYEEAAGLREVEARRLAAIRDSMLNTLSANIDGLVVNGDIQYALPHMLNISIPNIQSEYVTLALDRAGIAVSTKSACREGEESESHVVAALFSKSPGEKWRARSTLRFSLGVENTEKQAQKAARALAAIVNTVRG